MFSLKLDFLIDLLNQKKSVLEKILNITENQNTILDSKDKSKETNVFFNEMNKEKHMLIDEVMELDKAFQSSFDEISDIFDSEALEHKEKVIKMQDLIEYVLNLDINIRAVEQKNKEIIEMGKKPINKKTPLNKNYVYEKYKKNYIPKDEDEE